MSMTIREQLEIRETTYLSPYATLSSKSKGRERPEEECDIRPVFQRDRDRILHCKSFRRLKQKTQVFLLPKGDHYRTRLTHTLEVSQNARTIAIIVISNLRFIIFCLLVLPCICVCPAVASPQGYGRIRITSNSAIS